MDRLAWQFRRMAMVVLPVVLLIAFSGSLSRWLAPPIIITVSLKVSEQHPTEATYLSFMTELDSAVKNTTTDTILERPLLGVQNLKKPPAYWVNVELTDTAGNRLLTLAYRSDNLYLSGFANRHNEWFAFKGQQATLPRSTALSYRKDYADIFGPAGWKGLATVQINRAQALANALRLADYRRSGSGPDTALKPALGFFILTIAEAERLPTLRAALAGVMDAPTPQTMDEPLVKLAVNWKRLSCALRAWVKFGKTMAVWNRNTEAIQLRNQTEIDIRTPQVALTKIKPFLRSMNCTWTH